MHALGFRLSTEKIRRHRRPEHGCGTHRDRLVQVPGRSPPTPRRTADRRQRHDEPPIDPLRLLAWRLIAPDF
jgi:hypothetical protein